MKKLFSKRLISILLVMAFALASLLIFSCTSTKNVASSQLSAEDLQNLNLDPALNRQKVQNGTIIQCWCWSFNTI